MSCENNNPRDYIWICFKTSSDLELFLDIVFGNDNDDNDNDDDNDDNDDDNDNYFDLFDRGFPSGGCKNDGWYYNVNAGRIRGKKIKFPVEISVRFPQKDYAIVLKKLADRYNIIKNKNTLPEK